jgi:hypothetical protein
MAGGADLVIPQGIAVRDAHACYEVVVLVTVPDKPEFSSLLLIRYMAIERLSQHPWRRNFSPQFTCTEASTQSVTSSLMRERR